jgi:hypothetical protein
MGEFVCYFLCPISCSSKFISFRVPSSQQVPPAITKERFFEDILISCLQKGFELAKYSLVGFSRSTPSDENGNLTRRSPFCVFEVSHQVFIGSAIMDASADDNQVVDIEVNDVLWGFFGDFYCFAVEFGGYCFSDFLGITTSA